MFNSRDEKFELPDDFYNPYRIGNYLENVYTHKVVQIIGIIQTIDEKKALLQTDIRLEKDDTIIVIPYSELKLNYVEYKEIIIKRLPSENERLNLGITFPEVDYFHKSLKLKK